MRQPVPTVSERDVERVLGRDRDQVEAAHEE